MNFPTINNKTVLVTGGAGFIGSNLCENLLSFNNKVVCLDNLSTGYKSNLKSFEKNYNFKFIQGDIRNLEDCKIAVQNVEIVLHQAALGSVPRSLQDPITTNEVNINGFLNMLIASKDAKVKRFVYAASSSTYGDSTELPKKEENIGKPLSPYAVTKHVNELYAHVFGINYDMEIIGLRYFNVFGRRQSPNGAYAAVIPKFLDALIQLRSPTINGDGTNSRDFTYIDNVIQMNHLAATTKNPKALGEIFNTATGQRSSLIQLFNILKENLGPYNSNIQKIEAVFGPKRTGDISHSLASIEKAKRELGYSPSHNLSDGINETIQWYLKTKKLI